MAALNISNVLLADRRVTKPHSDKYIKGAMLLLYITYLRCKEFTQDLRVEFHQQINCSRYTVNSERPMAVLLLDYANRLGDDAGYKIIIDHFTQKIPLTLTGAALDKEFTQQLESVFLSKPVTCVDDRIMMVCLITADLVCEAVKAGSILRAAQIFNISYDMIGDLYNRPNCSYQEFMIGPQRMLGWLGIYETLIDPNRVCDMRVAATALLPSIPGGGQQQLVNVAPAPKIPKLIPAAVPAAQVAPAAGQPIQFFVKMPAQTPPAVFLPAPPPPKRLLVLVQPPSSAIQSTSGSGKVAKLSGKAVASGGLAVIQPWYNTDPRVTDADKPGTPDTESVLWSYLINRISHEKFTPFILRRFNKLLGQNINYRATALGVAMTDYGDEIIKPAKFQDIMKSVRGVLKLTNDKAKIFKKMMLQYVVPPTECILYDRVMTVISITCCLILECLYNAVMNNKYVKEAYYYYQAAIEVLKPTKKIDAVYSQGWIELKEIREQLVNRKTFDMLHDNRLVNKVAPLPPALSKAAQNHRDTQITPDVEHYDRAAQKPKVNPPASTITGPVASTSTAPTPAPAPGPAPPRAPAPGPAPPRAPAPGPAPPRAPAPGPAPSRAPAPGPAPPRAPAPGPPPPRAPAPAPAPAPASAPAPAPAPVVPFDPDQFFAALTDPPAVAADPADATTDPADGGEAFDPDQLFASNKPGPSSAPDPPAIETDKSETATDQAEDDEEEGEEVDSDDVPPGFFDPLDEIFERDN